VHYILGIVKNLRSAGLYCAIASNQPICRARFMSENLGYREIFDYEFYSCDIGYMKPEQEYFKKVLIGMPIAADETLFIDDRKQNVSAAINMGFRGAIFSLSEHDKPAQAMKDLLIKYRVKDTQQTAKTDWNLEGR
jgi:putative hydrolase of the HAD superfamily